jgi:hypothetical protein
LLRTAGSEAEFKDIAELALPVTLGAGSEFLRSMFGEGHGCIHCLPVLARGFRLDKCAE